MKIEEKLTAAGIHITTDSVNVEHLRFDNSNKRRVRRFETFQRAACRMNNVDAGTRTARLIGFELIAPPEILRTLSGSSYTAFQSSYVEWEDPESKRLDRRRLSALTLLSWSLSPFLAAEEWAAFQKWLPTCECYSGLAPDKALFELELDLISWSARNLPMALWGHVCMLRPMHALPRTTLARQVTGKVLAVGVDEQQVERGSLIANLIDVVDFAEERSESDALVRDAIKTLSNKSEESPSQTISRWTGNLLNLQSRAEKSGMASAVVLSWMADTIESGTARKEDADRKTRQRYCRVAALPLWRMLAAIGGHPDNWKQEDLEAGYLALMLDESSTDRLGLGAAISSFQLFLYQQWDVPIAARGLHKLIPPPHPRVQFVTGVEVGRAMTWIASQTGGDSRLLGLCQLAIALGSNAPFRIRELLQLRKRNIAKCPDGSLEIEIIRLGARNQLKTPAAVRRVHINDKEAVQLILDWVKLREFEGATTTDLMFAVQDAPQRIYRQHALHRTLLWILKAATGEPDMTFHALRHGWACRQISEALETNSTVDFNRLIHIADAMGHVSPDMTLRFYAHVFEDALHFHTMPVLFDALELTSIDAQNLIGSTPNTIRQHSKRWGIDLSVLIWRGIEQVAEQIHFSAVAAGLSMISPQAPRLVTTFKETLTPLKVHEILMALENGHMKGDRIRARFRIAQEELTAIETSACRLTKNLMASSEKSTIEVSGVRAALEMLGINLTRAGQPRYAALRDFLELPIEAGLAAEAATSWAASRKGNYFSAARPEKMEGLLRLFSKAGLASSNFVVQVQYADSGKVDADILIKNIAEQFIAVLGTVPLFARPDCVHPFRPVAYLTWPGCDKKGIQLKGAAAQSNGGLYALLFAVGVFSLATAEVAHAAS